MRNIVSISVFSTWETCQRTTFYVRLTTDEGMTMETSSFATGSVYTDFEGLSLEEARDRALIDAADWADFLGLEVEPFVVDGVTIEPSMKLNRYRNRRALAERRKAKSLAE